MNEFYRSSNGDSWLLYHDIQSGGLLVRHEANAASGGYTTDVDILVAVAAADQPIIFTLIRDSGQAGKEQAAWPRTVGRGTLQARMA